MVESRSGSEFGDGVVFAEEDYASLPFRFAATVIDGVVLFLTIQILWQLIVYLPWAAEWSFYDYYRAERQFTIASAILAWLYLTVCKASSLRTLGYRLTGLQIVNLRGNKAKWHQMTLRLLIWVVGPFNLLLDACWIFADDARQSCRDCYSGTLVIRIDASPIGTAPIQLTRYSAAGLNLAYQRAAHSKVLNVNP